MDSDTEKEEIDDHGHRPLRASAKRLTVMKDCTMSMDSEASVYTQNSSGLSDGHQPPRPAPLNLTQQPSPLLGGLVRRRPLWEVGLFTLLRRNRRRWRIHMYLASFPQLRVREGSIDDGHGSPLPLPSPITPNFASAMRMKIEDGRSEKGGTVAEDEKNLDMTQESSGLGNRIVVEDQDELPSRCISGSCPIRLDRYM